MELPKRTRIKVPRIADWWLECTKCGTRKLMASGFIGSWMLTHADQRHESAEMINWQHEPDICNRCLGKPDVDAVKAYCDKILGKKPPRKPFKLR